MVKAEGNGLPARLVQRQEDNIKMDLTETASEEVDWTDLVLDRDSWQVLVNTVVRI
jgi:hypothetical protein